jgi:hypothetical protein
MRVGLLILLAALLTASVVTAPADASATYWRKCGSQPQEGAGWYRVRAHNVRCGKARDVARIYTYRGDRSPLGFSCQSRRIGYELSVVRCRRDLRSRVQKVQFQIGA